jgi:predicted RNA binding protein YcfA (HicA-like mRNA interferase family)
MCINSGRDVKRRDIIKRLREAGCEFEEGGNHTIVLLDGRKITVLSRQNEIAEPIVRQIERQSGIKLR